MISPRPTESPSTSDQCHPCDFERASSLVWGPSLGCPLQDLKWVEILS